MQELLTESLCKTHLDAIEIARRLGAQFLWIDSLCIIQDDTFDWERESSQMATIYENALLTIAAAGSRDASGGCLLDRLGHSSAFNNLSVLTYPLDDGQESSSQARHLTDIRFRKPVLSHKLWSNGFAQQAHETNPKDYASLPLEERAWCFQERILSTRIAHFAQDELVFECNSAIRCECGGLDRNEGYGAGALTARDDFRNLVSCTDDHERSVAWMSLVIACTRRSIKYQKDRLPSLSGIAKRLQQYGFGEYLGGIWRNGLPTQLLWTVDDFGVSQRARATYAPSWSWASIEDSTFSFGFSEDASIRPVPLAQIDDVKCTSSSQDPTGNLDGGYMTITGPTASLHLMKQAGRKRRGVSPFDQLCGQIAFRLTRQEQDEMIGDFRPDFLVFDPEIEPKTESREALRLKEWRESGGLSKTESLNVLLLAICRDQSRKADSSEIEFHGLSCLVLRQPDGCNRHEYERIGAAHFHESEGWTEIFDLTRTEPIKIV
jgi:hypothetical protein